MSIRALLSKLDQIPEPVLLWVNLVLAGLVLVSNGGALAITYEDSSPMAAEVRRQAMISLPLSVLIVFTAVLALVKKGARQSALAIHGMILMGAGLFALVYASTVAISGLPTMPTGDTYFVWSVGLLSISVCYATFLASRYSVPAHMRPKRAIFYAPVIALAIALIIDAAVWVRMTRELERLVG